MSHPGRTSNLLTDRDAGLPDLAFLPAVLAASSPQPRPPATCSPPSGCGSGTTSALSRNIRADASPTATGNTSAGWATPCSTRWPAPSAPRAWPPSAGYGFAKYVFRGRNALLGAVLGTIMVPATALAIPTYLLFSKARLGEHAVGGDPAVAGQPVRLLPDVGLRPRRGTGHHPGRGPHRRRRRTGDLLQASRCAAWRPGFVTVLLFTLVATWNNYFLPLIMLNNPNSSPITVGLSAWDVAGRRRRAEPTPRCSPWS